MFVHNAIDSSLSHGEVLCHRPWIFPSISQEIARNANNENKTPWQILSNHSMCSKMPNDTTTAVPRRFSYKTSAVSSADIIVDTFFFKLRDMI